jgi:2-amino-4-hydroxy-6-hydroxymethyldihydropteridine diphosphokinase
MPCGNTVNAVISRSAKVNRIYLALGANVAGRWGTPRQSLQRACRELQNAGLQIVSRSNQYLTEPVGAGGQPHYLNMVLAVRASIAPGSLLRLLKRMERQAGRRQGARMSARPLDIDILDFGGRRVSAPASRRQLGQLVLPHPELRGRAFVLQPLRDVAPNWQDPVTKRSVTVLLARLSPKARAGVTLDSAGNSCRS